MSKIITEEDFSESREYTNLGPEFFTSRRVAEQLVADVLSQETLDTIAKEVAKKVSEKVFEQISDFLWSGSLEHNMSLRSTQMAEDIIDAVVSGNKVLASRIALNKYDQYGIRAAIAKLIPDEVLQAHIADLEKEIERLKEQLKWSRI